MEEIEVKGRSIEEIIERAGQLLNCKPDYLEYTVLKDERKGGVRNIVCKVWKREYKTGGREVPSEAGLSDMASAARDSLEEIVEFIAPGSTVFVEERGDVVHLDVRGDDTGLIIGRKGQTLEALQHLLVKILTQKGFDLDKVLVIDAEGYRRRRREMIERMARKMRKEALQSGEPVFLDPMSSFERRIVHLTLSRDRDVYTKSIGNGSQRQVVIAPRDFPEERLGEGSFDE